MNLLTRLEQKDEERWQKLEDLSNRESEAYQQIYQRILAEIDQEDCRLSKATPSQMVEELGNRGSGAILITFDIDKVDFENLTGLPFYLHFPNNMDSSEMKKVLIILGLLEMIREKNGSAMPG